MNAMRITLFLVYLGCALAGSHKPLVQHAPAGALRNTNPYTGDLQAARAGAKLYTRQCAPCHGSDARGAGKAPPLTSSHVSKAPDGALYWALRNGSVFHGMPSFSHLPDQQRWQIISYIKTITPR